MDWEPQVAVKFTIIIGLLMYNVCILHNHLMQATLAQSSCQSLVTKSILTKVYYDNIVCNEFQAYNWSEVPLPHAAAGGAAPPEVQRHHLQGSRLRPRLVT